MNYLFSLPHFLVSTAFRVTLDSVKQTFDTFIRYQNSTDTNRKQHEKAAFGVMLIPGAFEAMDIGKHWRSTGTSVRVCLNEEPFYRNNPTNYQAAMDRFMNIIKHVGPHIHVLNVHTNDHKQLVGYNLYTRERLDGTELKALSSNVMETILTACPSLQGLSIESTKFIDCKEIEPSYQDN